MFYISAFSYYIIFLVLLQDKLEFEDGFLIVAQPVSATVGIESR